MSVNITLQADLTVIINPGGYPLVIPSGTVVTFSEAEATGPFNQALDAAADMMVNISQAAFRANIAQFNRDVTVPDAAGVDQDYRVRYGPFAQAEYTPYNVSPSPSSSASASASASVSLSPSASPSVSPSASPSASPSVSPSASASASASASPSSSPSVSASGSASSSASPSPSASVSLSPSSSPSASPSSSVSPSA